MALSSRVNVELDATSSLKQKNAFECQPTSETGTGSLLSGSKAVEVKRLCQ